VSEWHFAAGFANRRSTQDHERHDLCEVTMPKGWEWDETLYLGSAPYYAVGRPPYAPGLAESLAEALSLDGTGRLLDVGCGPGILTLELAHLFAEVVGLDPDAGMLAEGERRAAASGIGNALWVQARAEELAEDLGLFRVAAFAQSFHWMDRERVAAIMQSLLEPDGAFVHVSDVKERIEAPTDLPFPAPPYEAMRELVREYLGPVARAGQGVLRYGSLDGEAVVLYRAGYRGPERLRIPAAGVLERSADDLVAWVYSLSGSAPHLFGDDLQKFERDVRRLLQGVSPTERFSEQPPDTDVFIWRTPGRE
jgi:SAM-dependent methyltransferase